MNDTHTALITALGALQVFTKDESLRSYIEEVDPKSIEQAESAIVAIDAVLTPQERLTLLPAYTKVAVTTFRGGDKEVIGQTREGAWGYFPDRSNSKERRITTTGGWELMTGVDNPVISLRILTPDEWEAAR